MSAPKSKPKEVVLRRVPRPWLDAVMDGVISGDKVRVRTLGLIIGALLQAQDEWPADVWDECYKYCARSFGIEAYPDLSLVETGDISILEGGDG